MQKIYNYFLKDYEQKDYVEYSQAKLVLHFCLITSVFSLFYVFIANLIQFEVSAMVMPILAILFLGLAFFIRISNRLIVISTIYLLLSFVASIILIVNSGMIYSSIVPWLAFIPMAANLLIGKKASIFWFSLCIATVFVLIFISPGRENLVINYNHEYDALFFALVYNGLIGIVLALSMVFQKSKDNFLKLLHEKNELIINFNNELKSKNSEILAQNEELIQQKEEIMTQREFIHIKNEELLMAQDELNGIIEKLTATQTTLSNREAENKSILKAIYSTQLLVGELNLEGHFIKLSQLTKQFLNLQNDELLGKPFDQIAEKIKLKFEEGTNFSSIWEKVKNGNHLSHDVKLEINGTKYWLKENFFPIVNEKGTPTKIMIVAQDISQLVNQKEKIELLNNEMKNKIIEIEQQNELLRSHREEIEKINREIRKSNKEIQDININLEERVKERTKNLEEKNQQLAEYAYINSHLLRGPLCSILGLVNLMKNKSREEQEMVYFHMKKSSKELHDVVNSITKAIEEGTHFDRNLLSNN